MTIHHDETKALTFSDLVTTKLQNELEAYGSSRGKTRVHESLARTSEQISVSYKGRTLIELIQNGYDAHPAGLCDGEISILLDSTEGAHGCLYVANRGYGFTPENFEGVCNIALSPKVVNQGIGNKGFGFKSVTQVCKLPEIYSQEGIGKPSDDFFGFCFRFPGDDELRAVLETTEHDAYIDEVLTNFPRWLLPVVAGGHPDHVLEFANDGFATVIRMPLDRDEAQLDIREQIDLICKHELPVQLFLERVEKIKIHVVEEENSGKESFNHVLLRKPIGSWKDNDINYQKVQTDDASSFLICKRDLPVSEFRSLLLDGVKSGELPESWEDWKEPATICVAINIAGAGEEGRLYNFLPMETMAESPCAAHFNAPFLCDLDRTKLVDNVDLNDYFLEQIAALCLEAAENVKQTCPDFALNAVPDLTMWTGAYADILANVSVNLTGQELMALPLVPCAKGSLNFPWATLEEVFAWPHADSPLKILTPERVAKVLRIDIVDQALEELRFDVINEVAEHLANRSLDPLAEELAGWAEKVAKEMLDSNLPTKKWDAFYADLTLLFAGDAEELQGKKIMLTADEQLARTMKDKSDDADDEPNQKKQNRAIFLPNTRPQQTAVEEAEPDALADEESEPLGTVFAEQMPKSLTKRIQLVNGELSCAQRKDDSGVRDYFIGHRLVNQFLTEDLQRLLANITANPGPGANPNKRRLEALKYAFQLSDRGRLGSELDEMSFRVPTRSGDWISARQAYFGSEWAGTRGAQLEELVISAKDVSSDLDDIEKAIIDGFTSWISGNDERRDWVKFLQATGVSDTMRVSSARPRGKFVFWGRNLKTVLLERCKHDGGHLKFWEEEITLDLPNPNTEYTVQGPVPLIPGQNDLDLFSSVARGFFAREILVILDKYGESLFNITVLRPGRSDSNETVCPSPILAFLRRANWLPAHLSNDEMHFGNPKSVWHLPLATSTVRPDFLPIVEGECRRLLDYGEQASELLQTHCGLNVVNTPASAITQVLELGRLAKDKKIIQSSIPTFGALYSEGWQILAKNEEELESLLTFQPYYLAARCGSEIAGFELVQKDYDQDTLGNDLFSQTLYLADDRIPTTRDLLRELDRPVFDFNFEKRSSVAEFLCDRFENLQLISNVQLAVYADGKPVKLSSNEHHLITAETRWLQDTILVIIDLSANFLNLGSAGMNRMRATIARIRYRLVNQIEVEIDSDRIALPGFTQGCLVYRDNETPVLLIKTDATTLSWTVLQQASHALAEVLGAPTQLSAVLGSAFAQLHNPVALARPSNDEYQVICRKSRHAVEESWRGLRQIVETLVEFLLPIIKSIADDKTFTEIHTAVSDVDSEADLVALLTSYQDKLSIGVTEILDTCRKSDALGDVWRLLGVDLNDFNEALRLLGPPYRVLNFSESQKIAFKAFLEQNDVGLFNCLRAAHITAFDSKATLRAYLDARTFPELSVKPEWAECFEDVPETHMVSRVNEWLASYGASPLGEAHQIDGFDCKECRSVNRNQLRKLAIDGWAVVAGWCSKNGKDIPVEWVDRNAVAQTLGEVAHRGGWMDFRMLNEEAIIRWLSVENAWPNEMPETIDLNTLGLSSDEIRDVTDEARKQKLERARLDNIITVDGKDISIDQPDLADVLDSVLMNFNQNSDLWLPQRRITRLDQMEIKTKGSKTGRGKRSKSTRVPRELPSGQKRAVGLLGEKIAFEWLKRNYNALVNDECWVSNNRELVLHSGPGNDLLGYDFVVHHPNYVMYYEVKATMGDDTFFRLGPTEVEAAIKYSSDAKYRFRVLFIQSVTEPKHTRIHLLPNPYSEHYRDRYRMVTKGEVGLRFSLT